MATPSALTDMVIIIAVLLGSITAGIMLMRPLRDERDRRRQARQNQPLAGNYSSSLLKPPVGRRNRNPWSTTRPRRWW